MDHHVAVCAREFIENKTYQITSKMFIMCRYHYKLLKNLQEKASPGSR